MTDEDTRERLEAAEHTSVEGEVIAKMFANIVDMLVQRGHSVPNAINLTSRVMKRGTKGGGYHEQNGRPLVYYKDHVIRPDGYPTWPWEWEVDGYTGPPDPCGSCKTFEEALDEIDERCGK